MIPLEEAALRGMEHKLTEPVATVLATTAIATSDSFSAYPDSFSDFEDLEHEDGEYLIEFAGRECYQSFHNPAGRTTEQYIQNILRQRHYSVLEHTNVTFRLEGVSRSFTHELIRHRHFSFSQLSQRYVDQTDGYYVCPPLYLGDRQLLHEWLKAIEVIEEQIQIMSKWTDLRYPDLPIKQKREAVRSLAPNAVATKIVVTGNLRAWRELLEKRWSSHADAEICRMSGMIAEKLKIVYPSVFEDVVYSE